MAMSSFSPHSTTMAVLPSNCMSLLPARVKWL
jgi:hypothetical protein